MTPTDPSSPAPDTLAARFTRRIEARDAPPPPLSQEPAAVLARIQAWLKTVPGTGGEKARLHLARALVGLMEYPELGTGELAAAAGLEWRSASRIGLGLAGQGLAGQGLGERLRRGRHFFHRLNRATEDALLLVVAGPPT